MCDTIVALGSVTADDATLFGKNSDREPNEAHHVVVIPAADHASGSRVKRTYVEIPQVAHTYAVLLAKRFGFGARRCARTSTPGSRGSRVMMRQG
jgi:dipeptidase